MLKVRGYDIKKPVIKDSFSRRAAKLKNDIIATLGVLGVESRQVDIELQPIPIKNAPASVTWYFAGQRLYYSYTSLGRFIDNLFIVDVILELEVTRLISKDITEDEFCRSFSEDDDVEKQRQEARTLLGVDINEKDFELITRKYKLLAKEHHPDMPNGNPELFKKINLAHKLLKRELV
ncbi:MAG: J domain-containing protein [Nanoarchaeota archaeon]